VFQEALEKDDAAKAAAAAAAVPLAAPAASSGDPVPDVLVPAPAPAEVDVDMHEVAQVPNRGRTIAGMWVGQVENNDLDDIDTQPPLNGGGAKKDVPLAVNQAWEHLLTVGYVFQAPDLENCLPPKKVYDLKTGLPIDDRVVAKCRHTELYQHEKQGTFIVVRKQHVPAGTEVVGGKWLDQEKKSRFVATQVNLYDRFDVFAGTPLLKVIRLVLSRAASRAPSRMRQVGIWDITAAFIHAYLDSLISIRPVGWFPIPSDHVLIAVKALYGLRKASQLWQRLYTSVLNTYHWESCITIPCVFVKFDDDSMMATHGDDFIVEGEPKTLDDVDKIMDDNFTHKKLGRIGPDAPDTTVSFLKRSIRYDPAVPAFFWSPNPKYVFALAQIVDVQDTGKVTSTPGTKATGAVPMALELLTKEQHSEYRKGMGLANYMSEDRPEMQFSVKTGLTMMQAPRVLDWLRLKRIAKFGLSYPTVEWEYALQKMPKYYDIEADSDWGACEETRKSTTGVAEMFGLHLLATSSVSQPVVTLSSGEAELYASGRGTALGLQMVSLMKEMKMRVQLRVATDSTANIGIQHRVGVGKMRHLEIRSLWLQEALRNGRFTLVKRSTAEMRGDLMTKYHSGERMRTLLGMLHVKLIAAATLVPTVAAADTVIVTQGVASGSSVFGTGALAAAVLSVAAFGAGYFCRLALPRRWAARQCAS